MNLAIYQVLDKRWTICKQDVQRTLVNENTRRKQTHACLLQGDKDLLEIQSTSDALRISDLETDLREIHNTLRKTKLDLDRLVANLEFRKKDFNKLKDHLFSHDEGYDIGTSSMYDPASPSDEVSLVMRRIDQLCFQAKSHKRMLSEKLALQRQLTTVEIELETERTYRVETSASIATGLAQEAILKARIQSLEAELKKESQRKDVLFDASALRPIQPEGTAHHKTAHPTDTLENSTSASSSSAKGVIQFRPSGSEVRLRKEKLEFENLDERERELSHEVTGHRDTGLLSAKYGVQSTFSTTPFVKKIGGAAIVRTSQLPRGVSGVFEQIVGSSELTAQFDDLDGAHNDYSNPCELDSNREPSNLANAQVDRSNKARLKQARLNMKGESDAKRKPSDQLSTQKTMNDITLKEGILKESSKSKKLQVKNKRSTAGSTIGEAAGKKRKILGGGLGRSILDDEEEVDPAKDYMHRLDAKADTINPFADMRFERNHNRTFGRQGDFSPRKRDKRPT